MSKRPRATPQQEPQRSNRSRQVSELLPSVGGAAFRRFGFVQSSIVTRWPEIVGERLASASAPESIKFPVGKKQDGTLTLVARGAHAVMIQHVIPEITERVNLFFGYPAVAKVTIRQGDVAPRPKPRPAPEPRAVPTELGHSLKTIEDPELKAVLEALAAGIGASSGLPVVR
nr:DciA family protein [Sphingomonas jeddahensis]